MTGERLTPEEMGAAIRAGDDPTAVLRIAIRSALAERDAQWREALGAVEKEHYGRLLCHPEAGAVGDAPCEVCPPLRALLDAAARSANKAVSGAADPE